MLRGIQVTNPPLDSGAYL